MSDRLSLPKRIQRRRTKGWRMPEGVVYVGRGTPWGNPYRVNRCTVTNGENKGAVEWMIEGPSGVWFKPTQAEARGLAAQAYRAMINHPAYAKLKATAEFALKGKSLACFCPLDQPCHADVLLELANTPVRDGDG